ncbi:hypothetical protein H3C67_04940 [Candidatus Dojkabacteria bacterium]|uniref:DUF2029 domain-containing protein n=2 Tax=Candidatus Dojkabacteria TaxID=74243 RepID=A0A952AM36_9BACT|nr:hypothetical protein [Candidatus Dojkabacteria bacterium]
MILSNLRVLLSKKTTRLVVILLVEAIVLRVLMATQGQNVDFDSYRIVAEIMHSGGNVYAETTRYNYSPLWAYILLLFEEVRILFQADIWLFRLQIVLLLAMADVLIALVLYKISGLKSFALYIFSPLVIFVSAFNMQFDNLALALGLSSLFLLKKQKIRVSIVLMVASLLVKHTLIAYLLWLLFRRDVPKKGLFVILPMAILSLSFLVYGIEYEYLLRNVISYRPNDAAPLYNMFVPDIFKGIFKPEYLLALILLVAGFVFRKRPLFENFAIYLTTLVLFAPAMLHSYLAIPMIAVSLYPNLFMLAYSLYGAYLYMLTGPGVDWNFFVRTAPDFALTTKMHDRIYDIPVILLLGGYFLAFFPTQVRSLFKIIRVSLNNELLYQRQTINARAK